MAPVESALARHPHQDLVQLLPGHAHDLAWVVLRWPLRSLLAPVHQALAAEMPALPDLQDLRGDVRFLWRLQLLLE